MFKKIIGFIDLKTIVILALIVAVLFQTCHKPAPVKGDIVKIAGKPYEVIKHTIDTQYLPSKVLTIEKKGKDISHEVPIYIDVPADVDTAVILKNYFAKNIYNDTIYLDSAHKMGYVAVRDTIQENKILKRISTSHPKQMVIRDTTILKELPRLQVFFGINSSYDKTNGINYFGPSLILKSKKDNLYQIGAGSTFNGNLQINGGIYWKLHF